MAAPILVARAAAALLDPKTRKGLGKVLLAILAPLVTLVALLCCLAGGAVSQNNTVADLCFLGGLIPEETDAAFQQHIQDMRKSLLALDGAAAELDAEVDILRVQAAFFVLCFGGDSLPVSDEEAQVFVRHFVRTEEAEGGTIMVPLFWADACAALAAAGYDMSEETVADIEVVYTRYKGV